MFLYLDTLTHAFGHEDALMQSPAPSSWIIPLCLATAAAQAPFQIPKTASSIITVPCIWSHRNSSPRQQVLLGKPNWCSSKAADKEKYQSPLQFSSWYEQEDSWASQLQGQENIHTTATMEQGRGQNQKDPTLFRYGDTPLTDGTVAAGSNRKRHWRSTDRATGQCTRRMRAPWTGRARGCRDPWLACRWWCPIALQSWIRRGWSASRCPCTRIAESLLSSLSILMQAMGMTASLVSDDRLMCMDGVFSSNSSARSAPAAGRAAHALALASPVHPAAPLLHASSCACASRQA
jgi:hypothetical protein